MIRSAFALIVALVVISLVSVEAQSTDYYVDYTGGDDEDSGLADTLAWKTLANVDSVLIAGNTVMFKRGETWRLTGMDGAGENDFWTIGSKSGTQANPITITAYGDTEDPLPLLTTLEQWGRVWLEEGGYSDVWSHANVTSNASRCFFDREGQGKADGPGDLDSDSTWYLDTTNDKLYVYSTTDPDSMMVEMLPGTGWAKCNVILLVHCDYVILENLALYGGHISTLGLTGNCEGVEITDCELRYPRVKGINSTSSYAGIREDILIENNVIDYMLQPAEVDTSVEGNFPSTGDSDGIAFWLDADSVVIRDNLVRNFSHTAILLNCKDDGSDGVKNFTVEANEITAPDVIHGRGWGLGGVEGQVTGNVIRWNYVHDTRTRCQSNGNGNDYYANVIVDVSDDENIARSNGMSLNAWRESYDGGYIATVCHDNRIFNNTIVLGEYGGIRLEHSCDWYPNDCDSTNYVYDNTIANNIIVDCGEYDDRYDHIWVHDSDGIFDNDFHNNCLFTSGVDTLIVYKGVKYMVAAANADTTLDDDFTDNISADPDFDDYGNYDFHVPNTSPCYKEGTHLGTFYDYDGEVYHNPPTMGAFEWHKNEQGKAQASSLIDTRLACFPNPSGSGTSLRFTLPEAAVVRLAVYDVAGRLVTVLTDEKYEVGEYSVRWDGRNASGQQLPSGVYFARLKTSTGPAASTRVILLH